MNEYDVTATFTARVSAESVADAQTQVGDRLRAAFFDGEDHGAISAMDTTDLGGELVSQRTYFVDADGHAGICALCDRLILKGTKAFWMGPGKAAHLACGKRIRKVSP